MDAKARVAGKPDLSVAKSAEQPLWRGTLFLDKFAVLKPVNDNRPMDADELRRRFAEIAVWRRGNDEMAVEGHRDRRVVTAGHKVSTQPTSTNDAFFKSSGEKLAGAPRDAFRGTLRGHTDTTEVGWVHQLDITDRLVK